MRSGLKKVLLQFVIVVLTAAFVSAQGCGGTTEAESGFIASPNYPLNYNNNEVCQWQIRLPHSHVNTYYLKFEDFATEANDIVEVRKCGEVELLGNYSGKVIPFPFAVVNSGNICVNFTSDESITGPGFYLSWSIECGGHFNKSITGVLATPHYPVLNYSPNTQCNWTISLPNHYAGTTLTFSYVDLALGDYVQVYQGVDDTRSLIDHYNSTNVPSGPINASDTNMLISFSSGAVGERNGFSARWKPGCGGHFTDVRGEITSPNYPMNYNAGDECVWVISVPSSSSGLIQLNFLSFRTSRGDTVQIRAGSTESGRLLGNYSGTYTELSVNTSGHDPTMWIKFKSTSRTASQGFRAYWGPGTCGGNRTAFSGNITLSQPYSDYEYCVWRIELPYRYKSYPDIMLTFQYLDTEPNVDVLLVRQSETPSGRLVGNFSGKSTPQRRVIVKGRYSYITFTSDASVTGRGFQILWSYSYAYDIVAWIVIFMVVLFLMLFIYALCVIIKKVCNGHKSAQQRDGIEPQVRRHRASVYPERDIFATGSYWNNPAQTGSVEPTGTFASPPDYEEVSQPPPDYLSVVDTAQTPRGNEDFSSPPAYVNLGFDSQSASYNGIRDHESRY